MNRRKDIICVCLHCGKEFHPNRVSSGKYCSNSCQMTHQSEMKYKDYISNQLKYQGQTNMKWIKKYILEEQKHKCAICGMGDSWNGSKLVFILDHIDGHANNNQRDNLRLVCPNCDSQLPTYKSKNKNGDRKYYNIHHR